MLRRNPSEHSSTPKTKTGVTCTQVLADTSQQPLTPSLTPSFADWLDSELARLELRFADYATPSSLKGVLGRVK